MKPEFIVFIALVLVTSFCITHYLHTNPSPFGPPSHTMTNSNGEYYEQIVRRGRLTFNSDSTAIASLTPGGYFRYTCNNRRLTAEASKQGEISYAFYTNDQRTEFDRQFLATAIRTTIARKFDK